MSTDEQAIRDLVATWLSATTAGDDATVLGLMAEDVVFLLPGQPPMRGRSAFAAAQKGLADVDVDANSEIQEVKVFDDWAYCWNHLTVAITPRNGGAAMKRSGDVLSVLRKQAGQWVIVRDANMLAQVKS